MRPALLLPEQSEGKTKVIRKQSLPFTVLKPAFIFLAFVRKHRSVATAPTVYGIETALALQVVVGCIRCVATAPTVYGMRRRVRDSRGAKRR